MAEAGLVASQAGHQHVDHMVVGLQRQVGPSRHDLRRLSWKLQHQPVVLQPPVGLRIPQLHCEHRGAGGVVCRHAPRHRVVQA